MSIKIVIGKINKKKKNLLGIKEFHFCKNFQFKFQRNVLNLFDKTSKLRLHEIKAIWILSSGFFPFLYFVFKLMKTGNSSSQIQIVGSGSSIFISSCSDLNDFATFEIHKHLQIFFVLKLNALERNLRSVLANPSDSSGTSLI